MERFIITLIIAFFVAVGVVVGGSVIGSIGSSADPAGLAETYREQEEAAISLIKKNTCPPCSSADG